MSETSKVTNPLIERLNLIPGVKCQRVNAGSPVFRYKGAESGTPDVYGSADGRAFLVECKTPGGRTDKKRAERQAKIQAEWEAAGAAVFRNVESVEEGERLIRGLLRGKRKS